MTWRTIENPLFVFEQNDLFADFHLAFASKQPPNQLFHYTTSFSFLDIINSQCMFATERSYLNDPQEFNWGVGVFRDLLDAFENSQYPKKFIQGIRKALEGKAIEDMRLFILSLSANPDLLSQWRAYSDNGRGFSIGFNGISLRDRAGFSEQVLQNIDLENYLDDFVYSYHLLPVIYSSDDQNNLIQDFVRVAFTYWQSIEDIDEPHSYHLFLMMCAYRAKELLISFKSPAYSEEQEWRIVATVHKNNWKIKYRESKYGITPYVKLNLTIRESFPKLILPITEINVGPNSPSKQNKLGIKMFCDKMGIPVSYSNIDYR